MSEPTAQASAPADQAVAAPDDVQAEPAPSEPSVGAEPLVEDDLLVEDVSIDGMCGVY